MISASNARRATPDRPGSQAASCWHWVAGLGGGLLVVLSWTIDAGRLIGGGLPGPYPWPIFVAGMLLALAAAADALRGAVRAATDPDAHPTDRIPVVRSPD